MNEISVAIFLGASEYPSYKEFNNPSFRRSKNDFEDYLRTPLPQGLGIRSATVLDLFGSRYDAVEQVREISSFLQRVKTENPDAIRNLFVYYVGHGYFGSDNRSYYLALSSFDSEQREATGFAVSVFNGAAIKSKTRAFRVFFILDCCFAAEALRQIMGDRSAAIKMAVDALQDSQKVENVPIPTRGSVVLCAASADDVALAPSELERTVFSDALLDVLTHGDTESSALLTFDDINLLIWNRIQEKHKAKPDRQVRPEIHAPDQSNGDLSKRVALFPNPAAPRIKTTADAPSVLVHPAASSTSWNFSALTSELRRHLVQDGVFRIDWNHTRTHPLIQDDALASERYVFRLFIQKLVFAASRLSSRAVGSANAWVCHKVRVGGDENNVPQFLRSAEREGHFRIDQIVTKSGSRVRYRTNGVSYDPEDFESMSVAAQAIVKSDIRFVAVDGAVYESTAEMRSGITHILGIPLYSVQDLTDEMEGVPMAITVDFDFGTQSPELHMPDIEKNSRELRQLFERFKNYWQGTRSLEPPQPVE